MSGEKKTFTKSPKYYYTPSNNKPIIWIVWSCSEEVCEFDFKEA